MFYFVLQYTPAMLLSDSLNDLPSSMLDVDRGYESSDVFDFDGGCCELFESLTDGRFFLDPPEPEISLSPKKKMRYDEDFLRNNNHFSSSIDEDHSYASSSSGNCSSRTETDDDANINLISTSNDMSRHGPPNDFDFMMLKHFSSLLDRNKNSSISTNSASLRKYNKYNLLKKILVNKCPNDFKLNSFLLD